MKGKERYCFLTFENYGTRFANTDVHTTTSNHHCTVLVPGYGDTYTDTQFNVSIFFFLKF